MNLLPKELDYLEPTARKLEKYPHENLDEDADVTVIEAALRERVKGLKLRDAIGRLTEDHKILKAWLKEAKTTDGPAFWIAGYLMRPGPLARSLLAPPPPPEPTVSIEPPADWLAKVFPRSLNITKHKLFCCITILDATGFSSMQHQNQYREELQKSSKNPWANLGEWSKTSVKFGECRGDKHLYIQNGKANWKQLEYLLEVPGGLVSVRVGHEQGKDFDEAEVEQKFHTLKIFPPKIDAAA